jgi:tape measure domain-containing protein
VAVISDTLVTVLEVDGLGAWSNAFGQMESILSGFTGKLSTQQKKMLALSAGAAAGAGLIGAGLVQTVKDAGKMEQVRIAFQTMEGSAEGAAKRIAELEAFDRTSPFNFEELTRGAQLLRGMGAEGDKVIPVMGAIGNMLALQGRGSEDMTRSLLQVGKIISQGKLQGDELNTLAENGVASNLIVKELGASMADIGSQGITAERFLEALIKVGNSGQFAGGMAAQAKTLNGSLSTLQGEFFRLSAAIGSTFLPVVVPAVQTLAGFVGALNNAPAPIKALIGILAVGLVGALTYVSARMAYSVYTATMLAGANAKLANSYYQVASAASKAAGSQGMLGLPSGLPGGAVSKGRGRFLGGAGGLGLGLGMLATAGGMALGSSEDASSQLKGGVLSGLGMGVSLGAAGGAPGMLLGGMLGAIGGGLLAHFQQQQAKQAQAKTADSPTLEKIEQHLAQISKNTGNALRQGTAFDNQDLAGAHQVGLALLGGAIV